MHICSCIIVRHYDSAICSVIGGSRCGSKGVWGERRWKVPYEREREVAIEERDIVCSVELYVNWL